MALCFSLLSLCNSKLVLFWAINLLGINVLFYIFIPFLILFLIFKISQIKTGLKTNVLEQTAKAITQKKEYQIYLLFLGVIMSIIEITFEFLKVRPKSLLVINLSISFILLLLYFSFVVLFLFCCCSYLKQHCFC